MFMIGNKLISESVLEREFVCNLNACKGACCVQGDSGAPLLEEEAHILEKIYPAVEPYLRPEGRAAIEAQGTWVKDPADGELGTPLVENQECAYTLFEDGIAQCGIEKAYNEGKVDFKKPISCHLYPVRISPMGPMEAVNYEKWDICKPACKLGAQLGVPVYKFLEEALTRKFGANFYEELEEVAEAYAKEKGQADED